jgi:uncharacterized protein
MSELELVFVDSIAEIGDKDWNRLAGTDNPFMRYEFLYALEATACTTFETGWKPQHVCIRQKSESEDKGEAVAVMVLYLKTNSWGEYVFDWSWANAYQSHGFNYYPKFVTAAPFTPSVGQRLFISPALNRQKVVELIVEKVKEKAAVLGASSWHVLFPSEQEHEELTALGAQARIGTQFHWYNKDYSDFDDFLSTFSSRKRKSIRKERKHVMEQGISFRVTEGAEISEQQWTDFYLFYQSTYLMRGMQAYLERGFFAAVATSMPEQLLLINAVQEGQDIAAALFFKSEEKLFGRYWGSRRDHQFLHFETCYYQGQEYAIQNKLKSFDSGAQGEHKIQRGFEPIFTYSNHWIANKSFSDAIETFLIDERNHIQQYRAEAESLLPFKKEA